MFSQSFAGEYPRVNRTWTLGASLLLQSVLVLTAITVPLLNPELLPRAVLSAIPIMAPPLAPPPPSPAAPAIAHAVRAVQRFMDGGRLLAPRAIPPRVAVIDETEIAAHPGVPGGLPGGMEGGVRDGVLNSILDQFTRTAPPPAATKTEVPSVERKPTQRVVIGGNVLAALLIDGKLPVYPPLARQARIEGKVVFSAIISPAGRVQDLKLVSGHPLLVQAALEAVRQWRYRPTMLNGEPVEVATTIEVNFTLNR